MSTAQGQVYSSTFVKNSDVKSEYCVYFQILNTESASARDSKISWSSKKIAPYYFHE